MSQWPPPILAGAIAAGALAFPLIGAADPCEAIPQKGPMPPYLHNGASFSGPVVYVGDGDGVCIALGPEATDWVEVRLADFHAPELQEPGGEAAKAALSRIALGRVVSCEAAPDPMTALWPRAHCRA
jgi:micrococcal nuclease